MSLVDPTYETFCLGDYATFNRTFNNKDFSLFAELSGDRNPLHWDESYSADSQFSRPIVPLHVVAAPLSYVAGMVFPGSRALYLGNETRAIKPVFYGEEITYSARIVGKSDASRTLNVRVIAVRGAEPVLDATLRVQVRNDVEIAPDSPDNADIFVSNVNDQRTVLITGAGGEIGRATAEVLAKRGIGLVLVSRSEIPGEDALRDLCQKSGMELACHKADLAKEDDVAGLLNSLNQVGNPVTDLLHAASPSVDAPLNDLMAVNFSALQSLADFLLPNMLARQEGRLVLVGSAALQSSSAQIENYVAAKAAASTFLIRMGRRFAPYGVQAKVVAPGYVNTAYSQSFRGPDEACLLVEEVADVLATAIIASGETGSEYQLVDSAGARQGQFGFHTAGGLGTALPASASNGPNTTVPGDSGQALATGNGRLETLFRKFFGLPANVSLDDAALDQTPGWDSLRHIEFMMLLEADLGVVLGSHEIEETRRYPDLASLIDRKLVGNPHGNA